MTGDSGILVTKILYKKTTGNKKFLIVDAGMNDFLRPALYNAVHKIEPIFRSKKASKQLLNFEVVGPICETADILVKKALLYKDIKKGDYLFIDKVGAYGSSMSSSYNNKEIASEVLINRNKVSEIKKRIQIDDFIKFEEIAPWL